MNEDTTTAKMAEAIDQSELGDAKLLEALARHKATGDNYQMGRDYTLLAHDALLSGQVLLGFNFLNLALDCSQRFHNNDAILLEVMAQAVKGTTYGYLGSYQRGLDLCLDALSLGETLENSTRGEGRQLLPVAAEAVVCAVGAGQDARAAVWLAAVHDYASLIGHESMTPEERCYAHEAQLLWCAKREQRDEEAREASELAKAASELDEVTILVFLLCRDAHRLIADGLLKEADALTTAILPLVQRSERSFVRSQLVRTEMACALALGRQDEAERLGLILYHELEIQRTEDIRQLLGSFGMAEGLRQERQANARLTYQARHDELTHLRNRLALREDYPKLYGHHVCAVALDVDTFKAFNDMLGHEAGDKVLQGVSRAIKATFMMSRCYRTGGDEFLIVISDKTEDEVRATIWKLRSNISDPRRGVGADLDATQGRIVTLSVGYAAGQVNGADELRALTQEADRQLYESKRAGRDHMTGVWA